MKTDKANIPDNQIDQLSFDLGCKINIEKSEWEKLLDMRERISAFFRSGGGEDCASYLHHIAMILNESYLRLIPFDDEDPVEVYIKKRLLVSKDPSIGVVRALEESLKAYDRIVILLDG